MFNGNTLEKYTIPISERVYIIEDADAMGDVLLNRDWKRPEKPTVARDPFSPELDDDIIKDPIDLAFLLNLLDGTLESSGRIVVFTSNYPERFDKALIRPGRIDMIIEFKKCSSNIVREMIMGFYDLNELTWEHPEIDGKWSPAEVNQILFRNFEDPIQAMREILDLTPGVAFERTDQTILQLPEITIEDRTQ